MAEHMAELQIVKTSPECVSYRLIVAGHTVWSQRAFADVLESHAGCKARMKGWAEAYCYRIAVAPQRKAG